MEASPHRLVETLQSRFEKLETEFAVAYWDSQIEATEANDRRREETELAVREAKGDPEELAQVKQAASEGVHDAVLDRQLDVLRRSLTGNQMNEHIRTALVSLSSGVESDFASFRPVVDGRRVSDNELEEILKTSNDEAERRTAWEASKEIGVVVADRVRELARLRNSAARDLGYADYYQMSLDLEELDEEWLFSFLREVDDLTSDPFSAYKADLDERLRLRFEVEEIMPWHYADPFFQSLPPDGSIILDELLEGRDAVFLAERTFAAWGIDISSVIAGSDLYPRERKCQHAFCLDVDRGRDVRILCNIVAGERWIETMLHESGHAAYDIKIDPQLPYLLRRPTHTFVTEAIAILSGSLVQDPQWLRDMAEVDEADVAAIAPDLARAGSARRLLFARWVLVMTHFERALYADPEADLDALWWEYVGRFQQVMPPPDRRAPDWAAKIHVAVAPVYYHNYLLGEVLASRIAATCRRECGGLAGVGAAGELLAERIFRHGALLPWNLLVEEATGHPLSAEDFAIDLREGERETPHLGS